MKNFFTVSILVIITATMFSQAPENMYYQAVVRDLTNALVVNAEVGMHLQIIQGSESGTIVYSETQTPSTNANGLISLEIGSGTIDLGTVASINWATGPYFFKTEIDPEGGTDYTMTTTSQIVSVPYAFYTNVAENLAAGYAENQNLADVVAINNTANGQLKNVDNSSEMQDVVNKLITDYLLMLTGVVPISYAGNVTDSEGNVYKTVTIGTQVWMTENLRTTLFSDETAIPLLTGEIEWAGATDPAYCWYGNSASNSTLAATCGALYNWHTVSSEKLCPIGWHVPSLEDITELSTFLGAISNAGGKLKEKGTKTWNSPNTGATNELSFTALPCGARESDGAFIEIGNAGTFWSVTPNSSDNGECLILINSAGSLGVTNHAKEAGFSVRCMKD